MLSTIHHDELHAMLDNNDDLVLLDVLPPESYMKHHLPGAINVPLHSESFDILVEKLIPEKSTTVVVYCSNAECSASAKAATKIAEMGYKNVCEYANGLEEWVEMGYELD